MRTWAKIVALGSASWMLAVCALALPAIAQTGQETEATLEVPAGGLPGMGDRKVPIDITANRLTVRDEAGTAIFEGEVMVVQGQSTLKSKTLTIGYQPDPEAAGGTAISAMSAGSTDRLKTITADGGIEMVGPNQTATAQKVVVDMQKSRAVFSGKVIMRQAANTFESEIIRIRFVRPGEVGEDGKPDGVNGIKRIAAPRAVVMRAPRQTVSADSAVVEMKTRIATLTGNVVVRDSGSVLKTRMMEVEFEEPREGEQAASDGATEGDGFKRMLATGDVVLSSGSQRAKANSAEVLGEKNIAILRGNVIVNDGQTTIRTSQLIVDYLQRASASEDDNSRANIRRITSPGKLTLQSKDQTVTANSGVVDMGTQLATLTGNVIVTQKQSSLRTEKMRVEFLNVKGGGVGGNVRRVEAPGKVKLVSGEQVVTADRAEMRPTEDLAILSGNVVLSQGKNVVKGCELYFNLATNVADIKRCPEAAGSGRVKMLFTPKSAQKR